MSRSIVAANVVLVLAALIAGCAKEHALPAPVIHSATARAEGGDVKIGSAEEFAAMKVIVDDDSLELRATNGNEAEVRRRAKFFSEAIARWRKAYADRGFVTLPKMQVGVFDDHKDAMRAETVNSDLIFINGGLLKEPERELDSTFCHECFHAVQKGSWKGMEASNELFTKWPDESTASWMQYTLCPESDLVRQRSSDLQPDDFEAPFLRLNSIHHPYRCFDFWCFLDELYGAQDLIHQLYITPVKDKEPPKPVEDHAVLLENLLKGRRDKKGQLHSLADVFIEYLVHTYWKKDRGPMVDILAGNGTPSYRDRLVNNLGKPGELKAGPEGRIAQDLPYVEGKDRKLKKVFETVESECFGISKQYEIASTMKSDETGTLQVAVQGPRGMARVLVFPRGKDGLKDPVIGEIGKPATVEGWEKLAGAIVLLVDVGIDQRHQLLVTAEIKAPEKKADAADLELKLRSTRMDGLSTAEVSFSVDPTRDISKEEEARALAGPDANKREEHWIRLEVTIGDVRSWLYGKFVVTSTYRYGGFSGRVRTPLMPGKYALTATVQLYGKSLQVAGAHEVTRRDGVLEAAAATLSEKRKQVDAFKVRLEKAKSDKNEYEAGELKYQMVYDLMEICDAQLELGSLEAARFAANEALDLADPPRVLVCNRYLAKVCLTDGDPAAYLELTKGDDPSMVMGPSGLAEFLVRCKDNRATAWQWLNQGLKETDPKPTPSFPGPDEEVLK